MKNSIITMVVTAVTVAIIGISLMTAYSMGRESITVSSNQGIETYNAGYRAGSFEIVAQLVECEGIQDPTVLTYYETGSDTLARMGELDMSPYPCEIEE